VLSRHERPLSDAERATLTLRLQQARRESRLALVKTGAASSAVCGLLGVLTALASDAPLAVIVAFWLALATLFTAWIGWPWRKLMRRQIPVLEGALRTARVIDTRLTSRRVVEFEEFEDEGACYAFAQEDGSCVFVVGQEFYDDDDFPNTDFSIIDVIGENGLPVTSWLTKVGAKLRPERVVPAAMRDALEIPEHLVVVETPIDHIEAALRRRRSADAK
jgi:hypothetical protein